MVIFVSSIGGAQAASAGGSADDVLWFLGLIFYSAVVALVGWVLAVATTTPTSTASGPRPLDDSTMTGRIEMKAYWEVDLAHLKPEAERLGMRATRTTSVRWFPENELPWLSVRDSHLNVA